MLRNRLNLLCDDDVVVAVAMFQTRMCVLGQVADGMCQREAGV